jgi:hypothetical protein
MRTYGTVIIVKEANAPGSFSFSEDIPGCTVSFVFVPADLLAGPATKEVVCAVLEPDLYTVTEADPGAAWTVTIECEDSGSGGDNSIVDEGARQATIILDGSETVTCTFTNTNSIVASALPPLPLVASSTIAAPQAATNTRRTAAS